MPFIPHTEQDVTEMLQTLGVDSIEQLFDEIPPELRVDDLGQFPTQMSEMEITRQMHQRANKDGSPLCFIGAGAYQHHIPAAIWQITTRGEFYSAYTPYQAEASQGTLQLIYEYQSMMTALTGMEVSNASMYDGASGLAEAVLMAVRANRKSKSSTVLMPATVHPAYRKVVRTLVKNQNIKSEILAYDETSGTTALEKYNDYSGKDITAVVIPYPNFFGGIEEVDAITDWAHENGAMVIAVVNPMALALLKTPAEWGKPENGGADIVIGEGQPLGIPLSSGGPYFGFMCCKQKYVRQMPGRLVGKTVDLDGKEGFSLTLQAREQHIRRSKATSNICTNQGLMVTAATQYMAMMGPTGLRQVALSSHHNMQNLTAKLQALSGVSLKFAGANFHEAVFEIGGVDLQQVLKTLANHNILAGYYLGDDYSDLGQCLLVNCTEVHSDEDIDQLINELKTVLGNQ